MSVQWWVWAWLTLTVCEGGRICIDGSTDTGKINQKLPFQVNKSDSRIAVPPPPNKRKGVWRCEVDTDVTLEKWIFFSLLQNEGEKDKSLASEVL